MEKGTLVSVGEKDRTDFRCLPKAIQDHYQEHYLEYYKSKTTKSLSFVNIWIRETPLEHLPPQAVLQFYSDGGPHALWIDCWERNEVEWVLKRSNCITE